MRARLTADAESACAPRTGPTGDRPQAWWASASPDLVRIDGWVSSVQRLAGNRAVARALRDRPHLQRAEPGPPGTAPTVTPPTGTGPGEAGPVEAGPATGREPTRQERAEWGDYFPDVEFRILRPPEDGYNCFAWALRSTSGLVTYETLRQAGYNHDLDGWTRFLAAAHGFGRSTDGLDPDAALVLYGDSPQSILHAARRADVPYDRLTFSSKLGGGTTKTPVILHAPADLQGMHYGKALRSFSTGPSPTAPLSAP